MPITSKAFDSTPDNVNPKLLDLFIKNPSKAYSLTELKKKFGDNVDIDIFILIALVKIEVKFKGDDYYYRILKVL